MYEWRKMTPVQRAEIARVQPSGCQDTEETLNRHSPPHWVPLLARVQPSGCQEDLGLLGDTLMMADTPGDYFEIRR